jgi:putative transposase
MLSLKIFATELVYLKDYVSPREARCGLTEHLRFYNEQRVHQALEYRTPVEVYFADYSGEQKD